MEGGGPSVSYNGRWAKLVPVTEEHLEFAFRLVTQEVTSLRWRYLGALPSFRQFEQDFWNGVLTQVIATRCDSEEPLGLLVAYSADLHHGTAYVAELTAGRPQDAHIEAEAFELFLGYLFACWNLYKVYLEAPEYKDLPLTEVGRGLLHEEVRLSENTYLAGKYWDRVTFAVYQSEFEAYQATSEVPRPAARLAIEVET